MGIELTHKLDWVPNKDPRNKLYSVAPRVENCKPFTRLWKLDRRLDQGREGACVGFGFAHELAAEPVACDVDNQFARRLYWEAQKLDGQRGGAYPGARPFYEGCDLVSGAKAVRAAGGCETFEWIFTLEAAMQTLSHLGPLVHGVTMTTGMMTPDRNGFIWPTGKAVGGHCVCNIGVDMERGYCTWAQSWGPHHGIKGDVRITLESLQTVMDREAETIILMGRKLITIADLPPEVQRSFWARFFGWR